MKHKSLIIIPILIILVVGAWFFNKKYIQSGNKEKNSTQFDQELTKDQEETVKQTQEYIYYISEKNGNKKIIKNNVLGTEKEEVYSFDQVSLIGNLSVSSKDVVFFSSSGSAPGEVKTINLKDLTEKTLIKNFSKPQLIAMNPQGNFLTFTSFSNVEEDYGYTLYIMANDGSNKKKIYNQDEPILLISWQKDGENIVFIRQKNKNHEIVKVNIESLEIEEIYSSNEDINSLYWQEDKIYFSKYDQNKKISTIFTIDENGQNEQKTKIIDEALVNDIRVSGDNLNIAFLSNFDLSGERKTGQIEILFTEISKLSELENSQNILGFLP